MSKYGHVEKNILKQVKRSKGREPLPDFLKNKPFLFVGSETFLNAFHELDTERGSGMEIGAIPRSAIVNYARDEQLNEDDLLFIIREVDTAHLNRLAANKKDG